MDRRRLPSVDQLVNELGHWPLPRALVVGVARKVLDEARQNVGALEPKTAAEVALGELMTSRLRAVINATGVLLHTNLGRTPLAREAADAARTAATSYVNLELDLGSGARGKRGGSTLEQLAQLCEAEAALAVNNNAAALVLSLAAVARERDVVVSRGELIEIGGSYRLPEIIAAGGARLLEVGTTNRTHLADYVAALSVDTGAVLKVHTSNYRIAGFTADVGVPDLGRLSAERGVPLIFDAGSGLLDERLPWLAGPPPSWIGQEPGVRQSLRAGANLVLFSGDKLFGGPQAGIVVGEKELVVQMARHPLARAFRLDGPTLAALGATADMYADGRGAEIPLWQMASSTYTDLERRASAVITSAGIEAVIEESNSVFGGGSIPGAMIPSPVIVIRSGTEEFFQQLLASRPPILARRDGGGVLLDLRTVAPSDDPQVASVLAALCR